MNADEALAQVIDRTALIENLLDQVLEQFVRPHKEARLFFWDILLNSAILQLGSKVKAAMAVAQLSEAKLDQSALHGVVSLRNAFAHHATDAHPIVYVARDPTQDRMHFHLQVISNSGKLTRMTREDALVEFSAHYSMAHDSLVSLLDLLRSRQDAKPAS